MTRGFSREALAESLQTRHFGRESQWYEALGSTNDAARHLAEAGSPEGALVVAATQTAGRGRLGRPWASPTGGLWFSLVLRPPAGDMAFLSIAFAAAAGRAIESLTGQEARVHWPNDVVVPPRYRKVGGVLLEARQQPGTSAFDWIVAGIGLDAWVDLSTLEPELQEIAATISQDDIRIPLLARTLLELEETYQRVISGRQAEVQVEVSKRCRTLGHRVRVERDGETIEGFATALNAGGALSVRRDDGTTVEAWSCDRCLLVD